MSSVNGHPTATATATATANPCPLLSLTTDALRSVLCRVPARDHDALRTTCRALRDLLNSSDFRRERCLSGWAEVSVSIPTREELMKEDRSEDDDEEGDEEDGGGGDDGFDEGRWDMYGEIGHRDESFGYEDADAKIWVDGKAGGGATLVAVPREGFATFHDATDAHSSDLQSVGWSYCDARGRPRLQSLKEQLDHHASTLGMFLYIRTLRLRPEYRACAGSTNVGAVAIRSMLRHARLAGRWTLAVYLSDYEEQLSEENKAQHKGILNYYDRFAPRSQTDVAQEPTKEEREMDRRCLKEASIFDIRQFIRAGFRQVKEMAHEMKGNPYHVFAEPSWLSADMMSHEEALAVPIYEPPVLPMEPAGVDKELFDLVLRACNDRSNMSDYVRPPHVQRTLDELDEQENRVDRTIETQICQALDQRGHMDSAEREELIREIRRSVESMRESIHREIDGMRSQLLNVETKARAAARTIDDKVRDESTRLVQEKGANIASSHVLHCASVHLMPEYVDVFMNLVPPAERNRTINGLDQNGCTPLMCATTPLMTTRRNNAKKQYEFIEKLLDLGADRNIVSPADGKTALGCYRSKVQSTMDFANCWLNSDSGRSESDSEMLAWRERMERLLRPQFGETPADDVHLEEGSGDESEDDVMDDDDEEEEDEEEAGDGDNDINGS